MVPVTGVMFHIPILFFKAPLKPEERVSFLITKIFVLWESERRLEKNTVLRTLLEIRHSAPDMFHQLYIHVFNPTLYGYP